MVDATYLRNFISTHQYQVVWVVMIVIFSVDCLAMMDRGSHLELESGGWNGA